MAEVLAIVPARSGSKSIIDKNLCLWRGRPLLVHAIEHGRAAHTVTRVIVSTDSEHYARIARDAGAEVPFLRPRELAQDDSTDLEVFQHALAWLAANESYHPDACVHLRPTYPSRDPALIDELVRLLFADATLDSVRTVVRAAENPFKMWFRGAEGMLSPVVRYGAAESWNMPRQTLPTVYWQNACVDVVRASVILEQNSMTGRRIYGYVMPEHERFDVDTRRDLERLQGWVPNKLLGVQPGEPLTFCFDIDGVIATLVPGNDYSKVEPVPTSIALIRKLFDSGHRIIIFTARGSVTGRDWRAVTESQLAAWGVPYHELRFGKPAADVYVDDKSVPLSQIQQLIR